MARSKITVRKIGLRWQPVDSTGAVVRGAVYNADGSGYSTRQGASEAAEMLREIGGWGIRPAGTRYFVAHPDEVQEVFILFHGLGDFNVKRKYRHPVRVRALDGDEFFIEESELYTNPAAAAIRSAELAGKEVSRSHATKKAARRGAPKFERFDEQRGDDWFPLWKFREMVVDGRIFDEDGSGKYGKLDSGKRMVSDVKVDLSRFATSESFDRRVPAWARGVVWRSRPSTAHARKITYAPGDPKRYPGYAIASGSHGDDAYFRSKEAAFRAAKRLANEKNRRVEIARITKNQDRHIVDEVYPSGW